MNSLLLEKKMLVNYIRFYQVFFLTILNYSNKIEFDHQKLFFHNIIETFIVYFKRVKFSH